MLMLLCLALGATGFSSGSAEEDGEIESIVPFGWHDGEAGVVTETWRCSAFGWAVDPDDTARDLQVQILADGNPVATVNADLLREDVGACPGGTCGFGVNLWGLIIPGVEHQISARAYDVETAAWVSLPGTPKALTCWGYPEGFHDGTQGVVDQYSCNANGWAVDPDNRERDVQVRVTSDGVQVASTIASNYREDMERLGICPGGTCAWLADLWGLISPDQEHQITAQAYDEESNGWLNLEATPKSLTCQSPPPPAPIITISTSNNYLRADHFAPRTLVTFTVYPSAAEGEAVMWSDSRATDESGFAIIWPWEAPPDLEPGNYVMGTDRTSTKELVLEAITLDVFDPLTDTMAGTAPTAPEGRFVFAWAGVGSTGCGMGVTADPVTGAWMVDLTDSCDVTFDMEGAAHVYDPDGDVTVVHRGPTVSPPPSAYLRAFPEGDFVDGESWPPDQLVSLEVGGLTFEATAGSGGHAEFALTGYDLVQGDVLTMTSGDIVVVHTVKQLFVTDINVEAQTVAGTVDGTEVVHVWTDGAERYVDSNEGGSWLADFSGAVDPVLVPGTCGNSEAWGEGGSSTIVDWCIPEPTPNPLFTVFPEQEVVEGWEWPLGESVHLEIDDPSTDPSMDFDTYGDVELAPWDHVTPWLWIDFSGSYDVKAGDVLTLTGPSGSAEHVVRVLTVSGADPIENIVTGTSDPEEEIRLWPYNAAEALTVTANGDGSWSADLDDISYDLMPGETVRAAISDENGNETAVDRDVLLSIQIDIKPFSPINQVACRFPSNLIPVALLSAEGFDASSVDPDSIRFGRTGIEAEVVRVGRDDHPAQHSGDVNGDGFADVVYYFRLGDTGFNCADIPQGKYSVRVDAALTGWTPEYGVQGVDFLRLFRLFD